MAQQQLADSTIPELLTVGPFLGIDASTSKYFLDQYHANDSIAVVPNRAFQGYVTARGRASAFAAAFASQLFGFTKFQRAGLADLFIAACNSGLAGVLQSSALGGTPSNLTLPISLTQSHETSFVPYQQWLFETNGNDTPLKIDTNLSVTRWQIAAPSSAPIPFEVDVTSNTPTGTLVAGTSPGTTVYFAFTLVSSNGVETKLSPVASATPSTVQQVQVQPPARGFSGMTGVNWYASTSAGGPFTKQNSSPLTPPGTFTLPGTLANFGAAPTTAYNLNGAYYYLVTFSNGFQESSPSAVSSAVVVSANGVVSVTAIPTSSDAQVTGRNIYRFGGTMQEILLVGTINDNTTTEWADNTADAAVTGQTLVQHRDAPQAFLAIEAHKGRIWGFGYNGTAVGEPASIQGTSDLWYSNFEEPWGFNSVSQVIPIGRNSGGDIAVALKRAGSLLCCLKSKSFWAVLGDTPQDFVQRELAPIGCASKKSVVECYGRLFWISPEGAVYMFDGQAFTNISDNRTTGANSSIKGILDSFSASDFAAATGAAYDQTYLISFPTQGITFMYDIPTGQWFKLPWAFDRAMSDVEAGNQVIAARTGSGNVDSWFAAETDLGSAITSSYISRIADSGAPQATKRYRHAVVLAPVQSGATATVTITVDPGSTPKTNTRSVDLGTSPPSHKVSLPPNMVGSEVQVTLAVTSTSKTEIHRVAVYGWIERQFVSQG